MFEDFKNNLETRKKNKLYREIFKAQGLDFSSNDYLNLSSHSQIKSDLIQALEKGINVSAKASPLLGGLSDYHVKAEEELKKLIKRQAVLTFSSGYQANLGLIPCLAKNRVIFSDELNHASLIDGIRLSKNPCHVFRHNDLNHLEDLLKKTNKQKIIITESLFSMSGDFCPIEDLSNLALKYQALLYIDEANSTGLFGSFLGGRVSDLIKKDHIITVHTGGKALASYGAFTGSSILIRDYLINNCRSFIYSTAPSPLLMCQWLSVLKLLKAESFRAEDLKKKALGLRKDFSLSETTSPILFIVLNSAEKALKASKHLNQLGYFIPAIRWPTVPKNQQGLRLVLHFDHSLNQLKKLKEVLQNIDLIQ
ncbi:MAG: aminotransferase class I/II-fold pyridoxal phosphate-dependent enzyme [Bdellovibrionaceae bacterium]|nr:aminotransferase class I/II-fold pyridoxal phosphate-dependent enzyme [Pseudobdellovibrionaceae bacterium]